MKTLTYYGYVYKQNPKSPDLFAFVASVDELMPLCGVARKGEHNLTNYQRSLDVGRVTKELHPFFKHPENCSPTAVVLSLQETPLCKITFEDAVIAGMPTDFPYTFKKLIIEFTDPATLSKDQVLSHMKAFLDRRLIGEEVSPDDEDLNSEMLEDEVLVESAESELVQNGDSVETDAIEEGTNGDEPTEIGTSMLRNIRRQLDSPDQVNADMLDAYRDMLKPALIIDGQHRLFGSASVEENIPFLFCALVEPEWKEQVFQFTVINDKATGIPKPFITSLAGISLTTSELDLLRNRLSEAGIKLWEVEVMQRLGFDSRSPLQGLIDFRVQKGSSGSHGLGYVTIKNLGKMWYEATPPATVLLRMMDKIYRPVGRKKAITKKTAQSHLQSDHWFDLYCRFWNKTRDRFESDGLWSLGSNFMNATVLLMFQSAFLTQLSSNYELTIDKIEGDTPDERTLKVVAEYDEVVVNFLKKFSAEHLSKTFRPSLNHSDGRKDLLDYFTKIWMKQSTINHPVLKK